MYQLYSRLFIVGFLCLTALPAFALVNINAAGVDELDTLFGIGPAKAQDIIDYRNGSNGPFETIEEIMEVSGIGPSTFDKIKNDITVGESVPPQEEATLEDDDEEAAPEASSASSGGVFIPDTKSISIDAGKDRTVFVGADSVFEANVIGATGDPIENARVVWSFGDGGHKEGGKVLYNFAYPGEYVVVADASSGAYSASIRVRVSAIPAVLSVSEVTSEYITIKNSTEMEVDLGGWLLFSAGKQFQFPSNTVILPGEAVSVSNKRTGLSGSDPSTVALQYPNGLVAVAYEYPLFMARSSGNTSTQTDFPVGVSPQREGPDEAQLISERDLITSPIVATNGAWGMWPWVFSIIAVAGVGSGLLIYVRRRTPNGAEEYAVEEIQ